MTTRGFLAIAQNNSQDDYIRQAYALALSIKTTQRKYSSFCICVEDKKQIPEKYLYAFDHIVEIPWGDEAKDTEWKINNKWKYFHMSPYDETIALDSDMLFTTDVSDWWGYLEKRDVYFTTDPLTFRGVPTKKNFYRKTFKENEIPNIYNALFYFKKSQLMAELTRMSEYIFKNWQDFYDRYLTADRPARLTGDIGYALSIKLLGIEAECTSKNNPVTFVHMKSYLQEENEVNISEDWPRHFRNTFTENGEIIICNYIQRYPFHYYRKSWLTDDIIDILERRYGQ